MNRPSDAHTYQARVPDPDPCPVCGGELAISIHEDHHPWLECLQCGYEENLAFREDTP